MNFFQSQMEKAGKNKLALAIFLIIFLIGIFLRSYHFSDWLHFEIDQTYDTLLVSPAVESGISNLPLLGPTAGGGRSLRLGPAFYYMEYLSAKIFGNNPAGHAMQVLILSILSLPLFYFFSKKYFSVPISLGIFAIFSVSLYLVTYSRFSWSPNVLPFLALAAFYCLLRSVLKNEPKKNAWFLASVALAGIASQIHFISFFSIPLVFIIFLLIKRPSFNLKIWAAAFTVLLVLYSPMIISDIKTHGQNFSYFLEKLGLKEAGLKENKEDAGNSKNLGEKIFQDARYNALEYFLVISGIDSINGKRLKGYDAGILCKTCSDDAPLRIASFLFWISGISALAFRLTREKNQQKKDFLTICALWLIATFLFFLLITYDGFYIYPRFFLISAPLAMIFLGLILEFVFSIKNPLRYLIFSLIILLLLFSNIGKIFENFKQLKNSPYDKKARFETEDVFPDNSRITLQQELMILGYMAEKYEDNGFPVYLKSIHELDPVFWYFFDKKNIPYDYFSYDPDIDKNIYRKGNYFLISSSLSKKAKDTKMLGTAFDIAENKNFGSLYVLYLSPKPEFITSEAQDLSKKQPSEQAVQISQILTWKKLSSSTQALK